MFVCRGRGSLVGQTPYLCATRGKGLGIFMYRWNLKSHAKLTTYDEVNISALSPVAMVTGAKLQAEYGFLCVVLGG